MANFISIRSNLAEAARRYAQLSKTEVRLATAKALTFTIERVRDAEKAEMQRVFDRPTPYTLNSMRIQPAKPDALEAKVWIKDSWGTSGGGVPGEIYLGPEIEGGPRLHKTWERRLISKGLMPSDMFAVPGGRARLDRYGNISRGLINQILSALGGAEAKAGYSANRTDASRKRRRGKQADFFVGRPGNGRGPLGVWQRIKNGKGDAVGVRPILIYVRQPSFKARLDFDGVGRKAVADNFPRIIEERLASTAAKLRG